MYPIFAILSSHDALMQRTPLPTVDAYNTEDINSYNISLMISNDPSACTPIPFRSDELAEFFSWLRRLERLLRVGRKVNSDLPAGIPW